MKIEVDSDRFDNLQMWLLEELVEAIRDGLTDAGIKNAEELQEATTTIAFSIAAILDSSRIMKRQGKQLVPVVCFATSQKCEKIISVGSTSFMHEYVHGVVDDMFGQRGVSGA